MGCWDEKGFISHIGINGTEKDPVHCFIATAHKNDTFIGRTIALGPSIKGAYSSYGTLEVIIEDESTAWWEEQLDYISIPDTPHTRESLMFLMGMNETSMRFDKAYLNNQHFDKRRQIYHQSAIAKSLTRINQAT